MRYCECMSKDARCQARHYYQFHGRDLLADHAALMRNPRAASVWLPQMVVMMMPVTSSCLDDGIDLAVSPPDADAWYVHLLVGDFDCACQLAQKLESLSLLCFQRGSRSADYHICHWARFTRFTPHQTTIDNNTIMGFMSPSTSTSTEEDPPVTTVGASDSYNTEQVYDAKTSKRKGLLSTILSKSSSSSSGSTSGGSSTLG